MNSTAFITQEQQKQYTAAPFQLEDLAFLYDRDWSANWSEMGCYKTTTIEWLLEKKLEHIVNPKVLVVTTRSGKGTYFQTVPDVLPKWVQYNVTTNRVNKVMFGREFKVDEVPLLPDHPTIVVTHYNVFSKRKDLPINKMQQRLLDTDWDFVILDEAHRIKNRKTAWTKQLKKLKGPYRHVMTGTGFINDPSEIWSLLNFLDKSIFSSYWHFRKKFCEEIIDDAGFRRVVGINPENKQDFRNLIYSIGVRRTKAEVFPNLPHPIYTGMSVDLNPTQRRMYDEIKQTLQTLDQAGEPIDSPNVLSMLNRLRQISVATPKKIADYYDEKLERRVQKIELVEPSSKLDALMDIIEGLEWDEDRRDQLVVFSNFRDPIELAKKRFDKAGISYIHMEQKDNDQTRYHKWVELFPKRDHQVFICTLQLGSESISLTSASTCVFLDRSWSPKDNEQGVSRVWRPGQEVPANIININARNTTDQYIEKVNIRKMGWFNEIFGAEE